MGLFRTERCQDCDKPIEQTPATGPKPGEWQTITRPKSTKCPASRDGKHHPS
jgi:hypothetical protein